VSKPSWKIRRRVVWTSVAVGILLIVSGILAVFQDRMGAGDLIAGGVALMTLIASAYIGGAVAEDVRLSRIDEGNPDG